MTGIRCVYKVKVSIITMINVEPSDLLKGPAKSMHRDW